MPIFGYQFIVRTYPYGTRLKHIVKIEVDDDVADPTTLVVYQIDPSGSQQGPFQATREAKGLYAYYRTYRGTPASSMFGQWETVFSGTGAAEGSVSRRHNIASTGANY